MTPNIFHLTRLTVLFFLALHGLSAQNVTSRSTFRADGEMVLVPVTVTDHNGKTIQGLRAGDFNVLDDQKRQQIISLATEDAPCSVVLVLDISGSMRHLLGPAKDLTRAFVGTANPEDEFLLLTVSSRPETVSGFTADLKDLEASIDGARPAGMTALIDTAYLGLSRIRQAHRPRRAMLIVSDGLDNNSRYSQAELMRVALEADTQIYAIILDNPYGGVSNGGALIRPSLAAKPWDQARQREQPKLLDQIAERTGGLHFHVKDMSKAQDAVVKIGEAMRHQYLIGYQPSDTGNAGKWHKVRVTANVPKVSVYARNGYYAR
jgi:Ca-activated chloride channel family protein